MTKIKILDAFYITLRRKRLLPDDRDAIILLS